MQDFTTGLQTAVAVPLMPSLLCNLSLCDCGPRWQSLQCPHSYAVFHYGTADRGGSPFNALIIKQYFTTGLRTAVAVPLMPSLLCSLSLCDCGPRWQSLQCPHSYAVFHYGTADCGGSPFNALIIKQYFTTGLRTAVAVPLMPSLLCSLSLCDCGPRRQSLQCPPYYTVFHYGTPDRGGSPILSSLLNNLSLRDCGSRWQSLLCPHYYTVIHYGTVDRLGSLHYSFRHLTTGPRAGFRK